ncbi:MBL fold metallo-hydrolase, partial [Nitrospirales bacterium NOB]|nr:MBL fold metallo-hydrolase [Nitrospirales bacterium NOB]
MNLSFHGAVRSVTGSRHLLEMPGHRVLLDCGLFQGHRQEADRQNRFLGFDPRSINAVLLSHAHIDHSGALPVLAKHQFRGHVHVTRATADLAAVMLEDSARLQENDCAYLNKKEKRRGAGCLEPFYDSRDARAIVRRFVGARYDDTIKVAPRVTASFHDAGHILGSAAIRVKYSARGNTTTVLFSGDLGRARMPILRDPAPPPSCDVLILESTYGDRLHEAAGEALTKRAQELVTHAKVHNGKIIVPAFALGRTQDLIMRIKRLVAEGRIDPLPIFIDSPLASKVTEVFRKHPECYDEETYRTFTSEGDPFAARYIRYVSSVEESKRLNSLKGPCVIIASSGMC